MSKIRTTYLLALVVAAGAVASYGYIQRAADHRPHAERRPPASAAERPILYYRDPTGAPFWSATPKNDAQGRAYLPVYDDAEPTFDPPHLRAAAADPAETRARRAQDSLLPQSRWACPTPRRCRRRTRWGWTTSPSMTATSRTTASTVKVSLDRIQRSGVRTEKVEARVLDRAVRAVGTVAIDESRADRRDHALGRLHRGPVRQQDRPARARPASRCSASTARKSNWRRPTSSSPCGARPGDAGAGADSHRRRHAAAAQSRRSGEPHRRGARDAATNPRTIDWPAPATGDVIEKTIINGQRVDGRRRALSHRRPCRRSG